MADQTKVKETHVTDAQGMGGVTHTMMRVRLLNEGEAVPVNAEVLPDSDNTPLSDWKKVEGA